MKILQIEWKTKAQLEAIATFLYSIGYSSTASDSQKFIDQWWTDRYHFIVIYPNRRLLAGNWDIRAEYQTITMNELFALENTTITVQLNDHYNASVTKSSITVGCQTFTHEKIKELYEASVKMQTS